MRAALVVFVALSVGCSGCEPSAETVSFDTGPPRFDAVGDPQDVGRVDGSQVDGADSAMPDVADADARHDVGDADTPADVADLALAQDPFPATLFGGEVLENSGFGLLQFAARDGNTLNLHVYRSSQFAPSDGPIMFVMHGAGRNADSYLRAAAPIAERRHALALAIEFDAAQYEGSESFTFGVGVSGTPDGDRYEPADWRAVHDYTYSEVEHVFEAVRAELGGRQRGYVIVGHSAGGQFVHRLLTFVPDARALAAVSANAGWYTMPSAGISSDPNFAMPYGLRGTPVQDEDVRVLQTPLTVLAGARDLRTADEDDNVRGTDEARAQGPHRFARANHYFTFASDHASQLGVATPWRFGEVLQGAHDKDHMLASADFFLFESGEPCVPQSAGEASGLVFNEILADPTADANGDTLVDTSEDEFVEIVNASGQPVCISGWTLGDAVNPERHAFPLDSRVEPGQAIVVFAGGVPTGTFGDARVQWAAQSGSLSLTNAGDVLTLRDRAGDLALQLSWGDCGGQVCATEHIQGTLSLDASIRRDPELTGDWRPHDEVFATAFSPGTRADGGSF